MSATQAPHEITFDDLSKLTDREIQLMLREVDTKDLAVALKGATKELKGRIFGNMSKRVRTMVREEMEIFDPIPMRDVEDVQLSIVKTVRQLQKPKLGKKYLATKRAIRTTIKRPLSELGSDEINRLFVGFAEIARREGIMTLENMVQSPGDKFLTTAVRLAVDGTEPELVQAILSTWMESLLHEQKVKYRKVLEGIKSIQSGDNPILLSRSSMSYIDCRQPLRAQPEIAV